MVEARPYKLEEAAELLRKAHFVKFDETVELVLNLGVDPKQSDQMVRGTVVLPRPGKIEPRGSHRRWRQSSRSRRGWRRFCGWRRHRPEDSGRLDGLRSRNRHAGHDEVRRTFGKSPATAWLDANPKTGTVTFEVAKAVKEIKAGKVEFRLDKTGIIHSPVGKISFSAANLAGNAQALLAAVLKAKPAAAKGKFIKKMTLTSTMGPGIPIDEAEADVAVAVAA